MNLANPNATTRSPSAIDSPSPIGWERAGVRAGFRVPRSPAKAASAKGASIANKLLLATSLAALLLAFAAALILYWSAQPTAPSLKIILISHTNAPAGLTTTIPTGTFSQNTTSPSNAPAMIDAAFKVLNQGSRTVRIPKGLVLEQRPTSSFGFSPEILPQQILAGADGPIGPGQQQTFLVRFQALYNPPPPNDAQTNPGWEFRAVCDTSPAEPSLRLKLWLRKQPWSRFLPTAFLGRQPNSYVFASGWIPQ